MTMFHVKQKGKVMIQPERKRFYDAAARLMDRYFSSEIIAYAMLRSGIKEIDKATASQLLDFCNLYALRAECPSVITSFELIKIRD